MDEPAKSPTSSRRRNGIRHRIEAGTARHLRSRRSACSRRRLPVEIEKLDLDRNISVPCQAPDGARAKRVLPQRKDQGHPEGAATAKRASSTSCASGLAVKEVLDKTIQELSFEPPRPCRPNGVDANYIDWLLAVPWKVLQGNPLRRLRRKSPQHGTTTAWKKSRSASSNFSPSAS